MKRRIDAVVVGITRNQDGYGDTARAVGVNVEIEYRFDDPDADRDKMIVRKSIVTLPYELRDIVSLGDGLIMEIGHPKDMPYTGPGPVMSLDDEAARLVEEDEVG